MSTDRQDNASRRSEFFIPDLCATGPVLIMVLLAELLVLVHVLGDSSLPAFSWSKLALTSLFLQWIVLLCAAVLCASRTTLSRFSLPVGVLLSYLIILLVTLLSSLVVRELPVLGGAAAADGWWMLRNLLMATVIGGIALRYFYLQQQLREREQAELTARLQSLRARIRPHFLFNTMNSIASLIATRPQDAEHAVEDLSELLRASLDDADAPATVADEVHLCELYLRIEQLRLGDRLRVDWQLDNTLLEEPMPSLILQPLVENAVSHGIANLPEGGEVTIRLRRVDARLEVEVDNPLPEGETPAGRGMHIAVDNISQRLQALFAGEARFSADRESRRHRVFLSYPLAVSAT